MKNRKAAAEKQARGQQKEISAKTESDFTRMSRL